MTDEIKKQLIFNKDFRKNVILYDKSLIDESIDYSFKQLKEDIRENAKKNIINTYKLGKILSFLDEYPNDSDTDKVTELLNKINYIL